MMSNSVDIVIPAYNEEKNLIKLIDTLKAVRRSDLFNVIIVNNGSTDNSIEILQKKTLEYDWLKLVNIKINNGYGFGIATGIENSSADIVGWTHADLQFDPLALPIAVNLAKKNTLAMIKGKRVNRSYSSKITTIGISYFARLILNFPIIDINAQPKLVSRKFYLENIKEKAPNDFTFDLFALSRVFKSNIKCVEFDVVFKKREAGEAKGGGASFLTVLKISLKTIKYMWNLRFDNF